MYSRTLYLHQHPQANRNTYQWLCTVITFSQNGQVDEVLDVSTSIHIYSISTAKLGISKLFAVKLTLNTDETKYFLAEESDTSSHRRELVINVPVTVVIVLLLQEI